MPFRDCIGHQQSIALLQAAVTHERLAHAYLFHGEDAIGKRLTAIRLAQALNCEQSSRGGRSRQLWCMPVLPTDRGPHASGLFRHRAGPGTGHPANQD